MRMQKMLKGAPACNKCQKLNSALMRATAFTSSKANRTRVEVGIF
jgi:hypothetical protein